MTLPRYSYYLYSVPIAGQVESYLNDQIEFAKSLPESIISRPRSELINQIEVGVKKIDGKKFLMTKYLLTTIKFN